MGTMLLFLYTNGHLLLLKLIVNSFTDLGLTEVTLNELSFEKLVEFSSIMFSMAVNLALPAIVSLLIVNLTFAVMTRSSPQLNIFTIGFPITLIIGLFVIYLNFINVANQTEDLFQEGFRFISHSLQVGAHAGP